MWVGFELLDFVIGKRGEMDKFERGMVVGKE